MVDFEYIFCSTGPRASQNVLKSDFEGFETVFNNMWADNADALSLFYSGTGALKTDFTRTGKRTSLGQPVC